MDFDYIKKNIETSPLRYGTPDFDRRFVTCKKCDRQINGERVYCLECPLNIYIKFFRESPLPPKIQKAVSENISNVYWVWHQYENECNLHIVPYNSR